MGKLESDFKANLKKRLEAMVGDDGYVLHQNPNRLQGVPDLLVLHKDKWAALETKKESKSSCRPNQPWHVKNMNRLSYAAIVDPSNEEEVLNELQAALGLPRPRASRAK